MSFHFERALQRINGEIHLLEFGKHPAELYEPLHYILSLGGKRLRPLLALLACSLYDEDYEKALKPALAIEVFHNFSLIHDDIMDQASLRRGQPTVHVRWDMPTAILSGDMALVEAYKLVMEVPDELKGKVFGLFSKMATEVCEGQQLDMLFEKRENVSLEEYLEMIRLKTSVLVGFSVQLGALIGGASDEEASRLRSFGEQIGLAFQIKDDYLDTFGVAATTGKQVGGDIIANKKTFLYIKALELADKKTANELSSLFKGNEPSATKVQKVIAIYNKLNIAPEAEAEINKLYQSALKQLVGLSPGIYATASLKRLADGLINRDK